jgi:malate synthase
MSSNYKISSIESSELKEILSPQCLEFVFELHQLFNSKRIHLLEERENIQKKIDSGWMPDFLEETRSIRESEWTILSTPDDLLDRRVEITAPPVKKMIINALNSGAKTFMADFEDSLSPTWKNITEGQYYLHLANKRAIDFTDNKSGKDYKLIDNPAVLIVRPRGWHLPEKNFLVDNKMTSGSLFDFGVYFFNNYKILLNNNTAPYFYLPKMENHHEARLWSEIFKFTEEKFKIPKGTIKVTVLIETILASFEMDEILYELKDNIVGLNCGRWDYIFSFIKRFKKNKDFLLPNRSLVSMRVHFMKAYSELLIQTCHKRRAHAIGGMAAQIPIKNNEVKNNQSIQKVYDDKLIEVYNGHDGTWVAHPGLVSIAKKVFDEQLEYPCQLGNKREDIKISANDLLKLPVKTAGGKTGIISEQGIRTNINVGILYIEAWLRGNGCVPLYDLMEDAATAEISRAQIWQWLHHNAMTVEGKEITLEYYKTLLEEELKKIKNIVGEEKYNQGKFIEASDIFDKMITSKNFEEFLTLPAYDLL